MAHIKYNTEEAIPFWRDERILRILGQVVFFIVTIAFFSYLYRNMITALEAQGMLPSFSFLKHTAGFDIGESLIEYTRSDSYGRALLIGVLNTIYVSIIGVFFTTLLGVVLGVSRLSTNFLVAKLSSIYLEILRNIPLLVLLIFWYSGVFITLPRVQDAINWGPVFLSNRGIAVPWGIPSETWGVYSIILVFALFSTILVSWRLKIIEERTGRPPLRILWLPLSFFLIAFVGWVLLPQAPLTMDNPKLTGLNFSGGHVFSPEFMALLSGLIIYTAAFIGEIIRAGIMSVTKGQHEAAKALGLSNFQTLRLIVFPQAMRVVVPPLTSQYLNLTKNTSLAVAIGYPDLFAVGGTTLNQSGRAVEVIALMMGLYLLSSLITSVFMNWYNKKIKLVER